MNRLRGFVFAAAGFAAIVLTHAPISRAEYPIERTGVFLQSGPAPSCDGFVEQLASVGEAVGRGAVYMGEWSVNTLEATGRLALGDPAAFVDQVNRTWDDAKTAANYVAGGGLAGAVLGPVLDQVIPDGAFEDFLSDAAATAMGGMANIVDSSMSTVEGDIAEIAGDLAALGSSIGDHEALGRVLAEKMQKWNPAASLSYVFTESDPITGMMKAAEQIQRQYDLVSTYITPYAGVGLKAGTRAVAKGIYEGAREEVIQDAVMNVMLDQVMARGRELLLGREDMNSDQARAAMATIMAGIDAQVRSSNHPFYSLEVRRMRTDFVGDSYEAGGKDWALFRGNVVEDATARDCINLGDLALAGRGHQPETYAFCGPGVEAGYNKWWARPVDFQKVWGDNCSGGEHDRSIWAPVCPSGFRGVGMSAQNYSNTKPLPSRIACLREDPSLFQMKDGLAAGLRYVTDDQGSGAKFDVTVFQREFAGVPMLFAVPFYPSNINQTLAAIRVPVSWGRPSPHSNSVDARTQWADVNRRSAPPRGRVANSGTPEFYTHQLIFEGQPQYVTSRFRGVQLEANGQLTTFATGGLLSHDPNYVMYLQSPGKPFKMYLASNGSLVLIQDGDGSMQVIGSYVPIQNVAVGQAPPDMRQGSQQTAMSQPQTQVQARQGYQGQQGPNFQLDQDVASCRSGNDLDACGRAANVYRTGTGTVPRDETLAEELFRLACRPDRRADCDAYIEIAFRRCDVEAVALSCTRLAQVLFSDQAGARNVPFALQSAEIGCSHGDANGCRIAQLIRDKTAAAPRSQPGAAQPGVAGAGVQGVTLDRVVGIFRHEPKQNGWHEGRITRENGQLAWTNEAGIGWTLTAEPNNPNVYRTGPGNDYLRTYPNNPATHVFVMAEENGRVYFEFAGTRYDRIGNLMTSGSASVQAPPPPPPPPSAGQGNNMPSGAAVARPIYIDIPSHWEHGPSNCFDEAYTYGGQMFGMNIVPRGGQGKDVVACLSGSFQNLSMVEKQEITISGMPTTVQSYAGMFADGKTPAEYAILAMQTPGQQIVVMGLFSFGGSTQQEDFQRMLGSIRPR